jgi:hypothetical protein
VTRSVPLVVRAVIACFGTLALSVAFVIAIGHPEYGILTWTFTFGFAWITWVIPPPPKTSRPRWWYAKSAVRVLAWLAVLWLVAALVVVLLINPS